ncbi:methyl-accepting chemotaxis protein [Devosia oryzisoli]|nr:methyl-accepting chemotaxis protein [Devosia oryzisoli]
MRGPLSFFDDSCHPAPGLRLALFGSGLWLGSVALTGGLLLALGPGAAFFAVAGSLAGLAAAGSLALGMAADQGRHRGLVVLARRAGLEDRPDLLGTPRDLVEALARRIDRADHFREAIETLAVPLLVVEADGRIVAASAGARAIDPAVAPARTLDDVFGRGYLENGGGAPEEAMVLLGARRMVATRRALGPGRYALQFTPAGQFVPDDDFDAFVEALRTGQCGFRFEDDVARLNPALAEFNRALTALDAGVAQVQRALGDGVEPALPDLPLGTVAGQVAEFYGLLSEAQAASEAALTEMTGQLRDIHAALARRESERASLASEHEALRQAHHRAEAEVVALAARLKAQGDRDAEAANLATATGTSADRMQTMLIELARWMGEIDRLTATVEGVSFRTNLLAINAAIEAARAGEKGAGFAVVADEVRQMAQISTRAAKEIRGAIGGAAAELGAASAQAEETKKIVGRLDQNLRNLRNETATLPAISGTAPAAVPLQPGMARNDAAQHRARA